MKVFTRHRRYMPLVKSLFIAVAIVIITARSLVAQSVCNTPLVGQGRVVDQLTGGTACLLCGSTDLDNLVDGDLNNYAEYTVPVLALTTPIVSIKDIQTDFSAGARAGFVVQPVGGLLSTSLLNSFQIRTYLNNTLQETITGSSLSLAVQGSSGGKQRISFVTTMAFDEIELLQTSVVVGTLSALRLFYAYVEPATGCDYNCITPITPTAYPGASIVAARTGIQGICVLCGVTNTSRVVDNNLANFGNIYITLGALGGSGSISVSAGTTIPAGYDVGFVMEKNGGGLLDVAVLGNTTLRTYMGGNPVETVSFANVTDLTVLGGNLSALSFKTTQACDEVRLTISGLASLLIDANVYYAFVRADSDNDGFVNCVDKCSGQSDALDNDGDGTPNGCDLNDCNLNAGLDAAICPPSSSYDFSTLGLGGGLTWTVLPSSPPGASVSSTGLVTGMTTDGTYAIEVRSSLTCRDTVLVVRQESAANQACNDPLVGNGIQVYDPSGGSCLLCASGSTLLNGNLADGAEFDATLSILSSTPVFGVKDVTTVYPAGTRTGFVVEAIGGLLSASLLSNFEIRTYQNNVLKETATVGGGLLTAGALAGTGNRQRISFVTTQSFDAVVLVVNSTLSLLTSFKVYYAFEEPSASCPEQSLESCSTPLLINNVHNADIVEDRTGIAGIACVGCNITGIGNLIDASTTNFATINLTVGVGAEASVSVKSEVDIDATHDVGFVISGGANLLNAGVLGGLQIRTYNNGTLADNYFLSNSLVDITLLGGTSDLAIVSFKPTQTFDEIRLTVYGLVSALNTTNVYYAFVRKDSDGDGTPDCADKCCLGSDDMDTNGDGSPDACDPISDISIVQYISNSSPSINNPVTFTIRVKNAGPVAATGVAVTDEVFSGYNNITAISNGGTLMGNVITWTGLSVPVNDSITLTFQATPLHTGNYTNRAEITASDNSDIDASPSQSFGVDDLNDATTDDDETTLVPTPVNNAPVAVDDTGTTDENVVLNGNVITNDTDANADALSVSGFVVNATPYAAGVTATIPGVGTIVILANGGYTFTPAMGYFGTVPTITYTVTDGFGGNDNGDLSITVRRDTDDDGVSDDVDLDDDNDGIPDSVEGTTDFDGDGVANNIDLDSDNDGLSDVLESGNDPVLAADTNGDGTISNAESPAGANGIPLAAEGTEGGSIPAPVNTDNAEGPDFLDLDSDNDGISDVVEGNNGPADTSNNGAIDSADTNYADADGDGIADPVDNNPGAFGGTTDAGTPDSDNDTNSDYTEVDSDNDGITDLDETAPTLPDADNNGVVDGADNDSDGIIDVTGIDNPATVTYGGDPGTQQETNLPDSDGDGTPDYQEPFVKVNLKVMLQGALSGTGNGLMRDDLRAGGYLPLQEPYTALSATNPRFTHRGGGGGETTTMGVLSANAGTPDAIVDWVFVELRDPVTPSVVVATQSALVQRDGDVVSPADGTSLIGFQGSLTSQYYVAVKHRNHLGVMTGGQVTLTTAGALVDFKNAVNADVYNKPGAIDYDGVEMVTEQGIRALWAGNTNPDQNVISKVKYQGTFSDNTQLLAQVLAYVGNAGAYNFNLAFGYFTGDVNMDGKVKYQGVSNDVTPIFVNVVGLYTTLNTLGLYNYDLMVEQIPD